MELDLARALEHAGEVQVDGGKIRLTDRGRRVALEIGRRAPLGAYCEAETAQGPCIRRPKETIVVWRGVQRRLELCRQHAVRLRAWPIKLKDRSEWSMADTKEPERHEDPEMRGLDQLWAELVARNPPDTIPERVRPRDRDFTGRARSLARRLVRISDQLPAGPLRDEVLIAMVRAFDLTEDLTREKLRVEVPA